MSAYTKPQFLLALPQVSLLDKAHLMHHTPQAPLRILGVDPGSHNMGWGIIDSHGAKHTYVASGVIRAGSQLPLAERLRTLGSTLAELIACYQPQQGAVETVFNAYNTRSALILSHSRGVAIYVISSADIAVFDYTPTLIKQSLTGSGRAAKPQVSQMVSVLLNLKAKQLALDESDALAVALTHAANIKVKKLF